MNILKIVFANIRKRKGASITFLVMVMLAAIMLSISLSLIIGGNNFYDKKVNELNAPHYSAQIFLDSYKPEFETFAIEYDGGKTEVSVLNALMSIGTWKMKSGTTNSSVVIHDVSEVLAKSIQTLKIIDEKQDGTAGIVLPLNFKTSGFKSGEKIALDCNGENYEFMIRGFAEDVLNGASTTGLNNAYVDAETFANLKSGKAFTEFMLLQVRFDDGAKCIAFESAFNKYSRLQANEIFNATVENGRAGAMVFVNMMSLILIIFSVIILMIAFIVAAFSINNSVEEDIATIGALKSLGYKTKALRGSQMIQYLAIAFAGALVGALISLLTFGFLGNMIASTSGLLWVNGANIIPVLITIVSIFALTALIVYLATRKYKRITPINALRQGDSNHSFKKNKMPLKNSNMPLQIHLGLKRFFKSIKNNITLFIVSSLLVFVSVFVFAMSYNLNINQTAMIQMIGLEMAEVWVQPGPDADIDEINKEIKSHNNEVSRTMLTGSVICSTDGYESNVSCVEDYGALIVNTIIKGRYPTLYSEIVLASNAARATGKTVGDSVTLEIYGESRSYVVVGLSQDIGNGGVYSSITTEAMLRHYPDFKMDTIYVYLNSGVDTAGYNDKLKDIYGNEIMSIVTSGQMDTMLSSLGNPFAAVSIVMIVVTVIVIAFILFLIISALIRKEKKELGIMKAIGYKNRHLIVHILISLLPSLFLGAVLGVVLGLVLANPLMSVIMSSMGLLSTYFIIPALPSILISLGIFGVSVLTIYLIALRLRKISPQKLIVEQ